ncbi:MAG: DUF4924 family protein [Roseivirga sp.]|nr:DUF4924 family protein [Roseivirga sp.]
MLLADKKKQENISEYIIHMYQSELLVRTFDLDISKIKAQVIDSIPKGGTDKVALEAWYTKLISDMKDEALEMEGHLSYVQDEVQKLSNLSVELLGENENYRQVFNAARPAIRESIIGSEGLVNDPIQACLNGVFGLLLSRMNGIIVEQEQLDKVEHFGNVLSYLSYYHGNPK